MQRIEADLLIPRSGDPIRDGVVLADSGQISYAGPAATAPDTPGAAIHQAAVAMPGLWDCHGHFMGSLTLDISKTPLEPVQLRAARCTRDLRSALDAGVTSVREVGGMGVYLARAVAEGRWRVRPSTARAQSCPPRAATQTSTPIRWTGSGMARWVSAGSPTVPPSAPGQPVSSFG